MQRKDYKNLTVWQRSIELVTEVYKLVRLLPQEEMYALSGQIRRAAISVPSNIAEGQQRNTQKEFLHFLSIAKGSVAELQTQLIIGLNLRYFSQEQINESMKLSVEVAKMLNSLIKSISD